MKTGREVQAPTGLAFAKHGVGRHSSSYHYIVADGSSPLTLCGKESHHETFSLQEGRLSAFGVCKDCERKERDRR